MLPHDGVDLFDGKLVQTRDFRFGPERRRHDLPRFVPASDVNNEPRLVIPVPASPVGVSHPVRTALLEYIDNPRARDPLGLVRYFDEKACHGVSLAAEYVEWRFTPSASGCFKSQHDDRAAGRQARVPTSSRYSTVVRVGPVAFRHLENLERGVTSCGCHTFFLL